MKEPFNFETVRAAFRTGEIYSANRDQLEQAIGGLANDRILNDSVRHEALIMSEGIHSILLRRLLDEQEKRNKKAQFWFMVLAAAGVLGAIVQVLIAVTR